MIFALFAGMPVCASAAKRIYFAGYMGLNMMGKRDFSETVNNVDGELGIDDGESFAGAIGFKLTPQLRIEGELSYMTADLTGVSITNLGDFDIGGGVDSTFAMINLYYDFDFDWKRIRPFIGAGIGYAWHDGSITDVSGFAVDAEGDSSGYVWQVGAGARYPLSETLSLIGAYRYMDGADLEFDEYEIDFGSHEIRLGVSWDLPFE
jgi:outer membrane autotransporter protein